jgi:hypothetical protein
MNDINILHHIEIILTNIRTWLIIAVILGVFKIRFVK